MTRTVTGFDPKNATLVDGKVDITTGAPPANVTVTDGTDKGTAPVHIGTVGVTPPGEPPVTPGPAVEPVCTILDPATGGGGGGRGPLPPPPHPLLPTRFRLSAGGRAAQRQARTYSRKASEPRSARTWSSP